MIKMKTQKVFILLLILCLSGCRSMPAPPTPPEDKRVFKNWQECFRFMGNDGDYSLTPDDDALFKLAAESSMQHFSFQAGTENVIIVVKLAMMRGMQDNGAYYFFIPIENGLQFAGRMSGNSYKWNGDKRFTTKWHMGARQSYESIYDWDGEMFRMTSNILYEYDSDGNKIKRIAEPEHNSVVVKE
ncbi:MAG: hypothetical protein JXA52_02000 [Planctomycetes bacterium]|nr:hypothetical protein [Planctomycetota bacterium]